jgi:hypothetical protein
VVHGCARGCGVAGSVNSWALGVREYHGEAPESKPCDGPDRDVFPTTGKVGRCRWNTGGGWSVRVSLCRTFQAFRSRWGLMATLCGPKGSGLRILRPAFSVTPAHRFRIGTASKVLTSAAAGLLLEKGRLKLNDEIHTYVPALPKKQWPVPCAS